MWSVLTARLLELPSGANLTYIAPNAEIAEALPLLASTDHFRVIRDLDGMAPKQRFDMIVDQSPIGHRSADDSLADGFGGEVVRRLLPRLSERGWLIWVTARGVLGNSEGKATLASIAANGYGTFAAIDLPAGVWPGSSIEGIALILRPKLQERKLIGVLRDSEAPGALGSTLVKGPSKKEPPICLWIEANDSRTFADVERERLLKSLIPRGRYSVAPLRGLLSNGAIERADRTVGVNDLSETFIYVPEYAGSQVTPDLETQTVVPRPFTVYQSILPKRTPPSFVDY